MSRARTILISLMPVLAWLVSVDGLAGSIPSNDESDRLCLLWPAGHTKHHQSPSDGSYDQAIRRWSRRSNAPSGSDGFSSPPALAGELAPPTSTGSAIQSSVVNLGLAQCWQFRWRAASEPRAPSFVS